MAFLAAFKSFQEGGIFGPKVVEGAVFGKALKDASDIPPLVPGLMAFILKNGLKTEGIFRKSGKKDKMDEVIETLDSGDEFPVDEIYKHCDKDIHSLCGILKSYYRQMPEPLLTYGLYNKWIALSASPTVQGVQAIIKELPAGHISLLGQTLAFLAAITKEAKKNLMTPSNLSLVFAPNLLRPQELDLNGFSDAGKICSTIEFILINEKEIMKPFRM